MSTSFCIDICVIFMYILVLYGILEDMNYFIKRPIFTWTASQ
jgi:hypothetical protein